MKLSRILVAVDGSGCANRASHQVMELARQSGAKVHVVSVVQPPPAVGYPKEFAIQLDQILRRHANEVLEKYSGVAENDYDMKVEAIVQVGHPAKVILDVAKSRDVDLIAVGARGLSGIKELFLGSVSHAVVRGSKVPVLVVK